MAPKITSDSMATTVTTGFLIEKLEIHMALALLSLAPRGAAAAAAAAAGRRVHLDPGPGRDGARRAGDQHVPLLQPGGDLHPLGALVAQPDLHRDVLHHAVLDPQG